MIQRPPRSPRTYAHIPYTTVYRSCRAVRTRTRRRRGVAAKAARGAAPDKRNDMIDLSDLPERGEPQQPSASASLLRSEEHTSEHQSLMRTSNAVFCFQKTTKKQILTHHEHQKQPYVQHHTYN